jgi:anti-sigma factor RsiW
MTNDRETRDIDPRLHAYLDGELSPSEAAAFEGDLRSGKISGKQLDALQRIDTWCRATSSRAPSSLARDVDRALRDQRAPMSRAASSRVPSWLKPAYWSLGWAGESRRYWIPAAAALGVLALWLTVPRPDSTELATLPVQEATVSSNTVRYEFRFEAGSAAEVCLAGDFNRWKVCDARLSRVGEDVWSVSLELPPGRYEYMFVVDGRWVTDPNAMGYHDDGFGNQNAILVL